MTRRLLLLSFRTPNYIVSLDLIILTFSMMDHCDLARAKSKNTCLSFRLRLVSSRICKLRIDLGPIGNRKTCSKCLYRQLSTLLDYAGEIEMLNIQWRRVVWSFFWVENKRRQVETFGVIYFCPGHRWRASILDTEFYSASRHNAIINNQEKTRLRNRFRPSQWFLCSQQCFVCSTTYS